MYQTSTTESNQIFDVKVIIHSAEQIFKYVNTMRNAYEHLLARYDKLSTENVELKSAKVTVNESLKSHQHKRRKADESAINDSIMSNDPLNEAYHEISSCVEDEIIESTPKPDATRKNVPKKVIGSKSPIKRHQIKVEKLDDSRDSKGTKDEVLLDVQQIKVEKSPQSPLRSVENQCIAGKENRQVKPPSKWITNAMISQSRVNRAGFISAKSPRGKSRLSLSRTPLQSTILDFAKKSAKETEVETCAKTFFDGAPRKPIQSDSKGKFLRQQYLEACINSTKDSDDENVFLFKSTVKSNPTSTTTSPPTIKLEPQTGSVKDTSKDNNEINQSPSASCSSSVVALSGVKSEIILIEESQSLFEDCTETFWDQLEVQPGQLLVTEPKKSDDESFVDSHNLSCDQCNGFMKHNPHLTMKQKLNMIDRCNIKRKPVRNDTDSEYWNPRMLPTHESQKQETLIDDRWTTRRKKT